MKINSYQIVSGIGLSEINVKVNDEIKSNWTPIGGVSVNSWTETLSEGTVTKTQYSQALVKYDE